MSGKYIPPAMRNKKVNETQKKIPTIDEFPSLGSALVRTNAGVPPKRSFALLASEWNDHAEEERIKKETRDSIARREAEIRERDSRNVFTYRHSEVEDDNYSLSDNFEYAQDTTDDWTTIEKKPKKEFTPEEKLERALRREAEERAMQEDSVWNTPNGDEWDYRDRRTAH